MFNVERDGVGRSGLDRGRWIRLDVFDDKYHSEDIAGAQNTGGAVFLIVYAHLRKPKHVASYLFVGSEGTAAKEVEAHEKTGRVAISMFLRDCIKFDEAYESLGLALKRGEI